MARQPAPDTRERILDTAARLFYEHGVRAVGMQQVVDESGCGKSLLYREFESKDALVVAYLNRLRHRWVELVADAAGPRAGDPAAQIMGIIGLVAEQVTEPGYRGCAFRNCHTEFPDEDHPAGRLARRHMGNVHDHIRDLARYLGGPDPDALAERIWLIVEGMYAGASRPGGEHLAEVGPAFVAELLAAGPR